ncbi:MAG: hypothetical protein R2867_17890 [Caldilineaceae bacterium]
MRKVKLSVIALLPALALLFAACQSISPIGTTTGNALTTMSGLVAAASESCNLATLKGRYLFAHSGTILPPAFGVTEPTPGADAGIHTFNGDGTGTDLVTVRVGSQIFLNNVTVPFTYTINADCTGEYRVQVENGPAPAFNLFVDPKGDSFVMISTEPAGNYVSGIDQRVANK